MWLPDPITDIQTYFIGISVVAVLALVGLRLRRFITVRRRLRHKRVATIAPARPITPPVNRDVAQQSVAQPNAPPAQTSDVEFYVVFPRDVSNQAPFTVYVCVVNYRPPKDSGTPQSTIHPESLVADVPNRGFISVALESDLLEIDAPVQSLVWRNRDTIAGFVLHPTGIRRRVKCRNRVWIAVNGAVRGTIDFDIEVDPRMRTSTAKPTVVDRSHQISDSIGQQVVRLLTTESSRAQAFKNAFVCYAHDDWHLVSYLAESLEAGGINVWIDALKMKRAPDWESQAQQYVDDADLAYVCWSARAARSDSIVKKELEWIRAKLQRKSGEFDAILFKMDRSPAPAWLEDADGKYSKRWQFFRAGMREQYGGL